MSQHVKGGKSPWCVFLPSKDWQTVRRVVKKKGPLHTSMTALVPLSQKRRGEKGEKLALTIASSLKGRGKKRSREAAEKLKCLSPGQPEEKQGEK